MPVRLRAAAVSDIGAHRAVNQDAAFTAPWGAAVADGVGGGPVRRSRLGGARAPSRGGSHGAAGCRDPRGPDPRGQLGPARAHGARLRRCAAWRPPSRGSSSRRRGACCWRTPATRAPTGCADGVLTRETRDDSFVQALVDQGLIAPEAAASHPRRNLITASLAGAEDDAADVADREAVAGDRWLLCSDGVTDYLPDDELALVLSTAAIRRGGRAGARGAGAGGRHARQRHRGRLRRGAR